MVTLPEKHTHIVWRPRSKASNRFTPRAESILRARLHAGKCTGKGVDATRDALRPVEVLAHACGCGA